MPAKDPESWPLVPLWDDEDAIGAAVDANSDRLIKEFYEHFAEVRASNASIDQRQAFEGWMIQKLSSVQLLIMQMNERINLIAEFTPRKGRRSS